MYPRGLYKRYRIDEEIPIPRWTHYRLQYDILQQTEARIEDENFQGAELAAENAQDINNMLVSVCKWYEYVFRLEISQITRILRFLCKVILN